MKVNQWLEHLTEQVLLAVDQEAVSQVLQNLAHQAGFEFFHYIGLQPNTYWVLSNLSAVWLQRYHDEEYLSVDPIICGARNRPDPFVWSNPAPGRLSKRQRTLFVEAAKFGVQSGLSIPIRCGFGHMAMLTLASSDRDYAASKSMTPGFAAAAVGQIHAKIEMLAIKPRLRIQTELTSGQLTCLRWNAEGKTADVIADIEKMSSYNVRFHLKGAKRALGATTLTQAARIATMLDLI